MSPTPPPGPPPREGMAHARELPADVLSGLVSLAFPGRSALSAVPLAGGVLNSNYCVRLKSRHDPVVLRLYDRDPAACAKEAALLAFLWTRLPVPEVLYADPVGVGEVGPFLWMEFVSGTTVRMLKAEHDPAALSAAARAAGRTLAEVGHHRLEKPGWIQGAMEIGPPLAEGDDPVPAFIDRCRESERFRERVEGAVSERLQRFAWSWAPRLRDLGGECRLVHGDYGSGNLIVDEVQGRWHVAGILDWEFAVSGSPLADVGHFLRYELDERPRLEPHFSRGFTEAGGALPVDWRELARVVDLAALCEQLTREQLPDFAVAELHGLIRGTIGG